MLKPALKRPDPHPGSTIPRPAKPRTVLFDDLGEEGSDTNALARHFDPPDTANGASALVTIEEWYLDDAGRIVSSKASSADAPALVKTSALVAAKGRIVVTGSGSLYLLGRMDRAVWSSLQLIYPMEHFDPEAPLDNVGARRALRFAARIARGDAADTWKRVKADLALLEEQLGAPEVVGPEMSRIRGIFQSMGLK